MHSFLFHGFSVGSDVAQRLKGTVDKFKGFSLAERLPARNEQGAHRKQVGTIFFPNLSLCVKNIYFACHGHKLSLPGHPRDLPSRTGSKVIRNHGIIRRRARYFFSFSSVLLCQIWLTLLGLFQLLIPIFSNFVLQRNALQNTSIKVLQRHVSAAGLTAIVVAILPNSPGRWCIGRSHIHRAVRSTGSVPAETRRVIVSNRDGGDDALARRKCGWNGVSGHESGRIFYGGSFRQIQQSIAWSIARKKKYSTKKSVSFSLVLGIPMIYFSSILTKCYRHFSSIVLWIYFCECVQGNQKVTRNLVQLWSSYVLQTPASPHSPAGRPRSGSQSPYRRTYSNSSKGVHLKQGILGKRKGMNCLWKISVKLRPSTTAFTKRNFVEFCWILIFLVFVFIFLGGSFVAGPTGFCLFVFVTAESDDERDPDKRFCLNLSAAGSMESMDVQAGDLWWEFRVSGPTLCTIFVHKTGSCDFEINNVYFSFFSFILRQVVEFVFLMHGSYECYEAYGYCCDFDEFDDFESDSSCTHA